MPISKETQERIEQNAAKEYGYNSSLPLRLQEKIDFKREGYIKGATTESTRAQILEEALEKMNAELDKIWNTPGISKTIPDNIIKKINKTQQESAQKLHQYRNTP